MRGGGLNTSRKCINNLRYAEIFDKDVSFIAVLQDIVIINEV